ncbi:hypothetical protein DCAR_0208857 [Daucus carota subsp. sativus]|uniref:Serine aminopeptidase S33 domain-containing protein n=1 Tax=Daucus carota subsp. sativus TaxID=79200 RepID=A0AAF0WI84_DAUCS|nr:PREDICTED: caffeoylshikimate esterase-like [Daucus carota subsp. sativus]WOG89619.1 hypothetical protein DCAR_0208857 [Daucus carota subsp. sativus]
MVHPIHQANENSPYGDLTRGLFYEKHQILHHHSYMINKQNMKIWTQSWCPYPNSTPRLCGIVCMIHGYASESSWIFELTAVAIARAGFIVCALDLQGHGYSDGCAGHIPDIYAIVDDCIQFFDAVRGSNSTLPAFLYGESLGGAIAILVCLKQAGTWNGLVLSGAMCGVSKRIRPMWPLEKLLPVAAFIAPGWRVKITKSPGSKSYKEDWKRKLVSKSPNRGRLTSSQPPAATALEFFRVCKIIERDCHELEVPLLVVHGGQDEVCDPGSARNVFKSASSTDKTFKIFEGMWHMLIGEPNEGVETVFQTILSWIGERADKEG